MKHFQVLSIENIGTKRIIQWVPLEGSPENVGLQKEQKFNTFACHTCNEVRLCVLGIRKKEVGNTKR
jgi:hypothetical protein